MIEDFLIENSSIGSLAIEDSKVNAFESDESTIRRQTFMAKEPKEEETAPPSKTTSSRTAAYKTSQSSQQNNNSNNKPSSNSKKKGQIRR